MKIFRAIVLTATLVYFLSFALNVASFGWSSQRGFYTQGHQGWNRFGALIFSAVLGIWYYGLRKQKLWAWRFGAILFAAAIVQILSEGAGCFLYPADSFDKWWGLLSATGSAGLFFAADWNWWRCKKSSFQKANVAPCLV